MDFNNKRMYIVSNKLKNIIIINKIGGKTEEENLKFLKSKKNKNDEENFGINYNNDKNM